MLNCNSNSMNGENQTIVSPVMLGQKKVNESGCGGMGLFDCRTDRFSPKPKSY